MERYTMKEIKLNQDGILNILNLDKLYVMRFNWILVGEPELGIKYYIATKIRNKLWSFRRDRDKWFNSELDSDCLQYCIDNMIRHNNKYHYTRFNIFEFKDHREFTEYLEQENNIQHPL